MFEKLKKLRESNVAEVFTEVNAEEETEVNIDDAFVIVPLEETKSEHLSVQPYSYWKSVFKIFVHKPSAIFAASVLLLLILGCIIIPLCIDPDSLNYHISAENDLSNIDPCGRFIFGTDFNGRDMWSLCWVATGKSLWLALRASVINVAIGVVIGFIWGYFRKLDRIFIEIYNFISNVPSMLVYMLISFVFASAFPALTPEFRLTFCLCLFGWLGMARFIRNQVIIITDREYNVASVTLGTPAHRIITRNLLPYILAVIITETSLMIPSMISSEVTLSYFGLGLKSTDVSLGAILTLGIQEFGQHNNQLLFPALMLAIIILVFFMLGIALSDALDPKTHR